MVRASRRRQNRHRQFLRRSLQKRMGCCPVRGGSSCRTSKRAPACSPTALRESTLPAAVKEAASANLSTLATTTCFRTADGEFHAFEGSDDTAGMLLRQLHPCVELRNRHHVSVPVVCAVAAAQRVRLFHGRCGRHPFPPAPARRQGAFRIRRRRRTDGPDHPCVARLEDQR